MTEQELCLGEYIRLSGLPAPRRHTVVGPMLAKKIKPSKKIQKKSKFSQYSFPLPIQKEKQKKTRGGNINLKQLALFRLIEKKILTENEAKILNALFEKSPMDAFEIQKQTWLDANDLMQAIQNLCTKKIAKEKYGAITSDFFDAMEKLLEEKQTALAKA